MSGRDLQYWFIAIIAAFAATVGIIIATWLFPFTVIITAFIYMGLIYALDLAFHLTFPTQDQHALLIYAIWAAAIPALVAGVLLWRAEGDFAQNRIYWAIRHCWRLMMGATWVFFVFAALRGDVDTNSFSDATSAAAFAPIHLFTEPIATPWDVVAHLLAGLSFTTSMMAKSLSFIRGDISSIGSESPRWIIDVAWALGSVLLMHFAFLWTHSRGYWEGRL